MIYPVQRTLAASGRVFGDHGMDSVGGIVGRLAADEVTAVELVGECLAAIDALDGDLHAWTCLDQDRALGRAFSLDRRTSNGGLGGVPIGVKDIFDTQGLPTEFGSPIHRGRRPVRDAAVLSLLRSAGAITVGKTRTTEFAFFTPGPTANPHDLERTPGGSSSGSAAAVAAGMVPAALGSQTAGSVIRPAAFCGVVGYKPTFGLVPRSGVLVFAESLDTIGLLVRRVGDAELLGPSMMGLPALPRRDDQERAANPPTFILCRTDEWEDVDGSGRGAVERAITAAADAGATIHDRELPVASSELVAAHKTVMAFEASRALAFEVESYPSLLSPELRTLLETGAATSFEDYRAALDLRDRCRGELEAWWGDADALLTPASLGEAPVGLSATGDPLVNRVWTLLGVPCVSVPSGRGADGMPVAVQVIGRPFDDGNVLQQARRLEEQLTA